jgi:hypothetical protein
MLQLQFVTFVILICFLIFQPSTIQCRPHNRKIIINGHEWTVPDEPGWEECNNIEIFFQKKLFSFIR